MQIETTRYEEERNRLEVIHAFHAQTKFLQYVFIAKVTPLSEKMSMGTLDVLPNMVRIDPKKQISGVILSAKLLDVTQGHK